MKNLKREFIQYKDTFFITFITFLFILLRVPSLIEPYWYGDEGIYEVIGMALYQGRILYKGIWDNKPPLLYIIYGIFNGDQFSVRLFSLIIGAITVIAFFFLAKKLFENKSAIYIATLVFALLFGLPLLEGNIANAENFMLLPTILAFYIVVSRNHSRSLLYSCLAGFLLSLAFLTKIVAIFDLGALTVIIFLLSYFDSTLLKKRGNFLKRLDLKKGIRFVKDEGLMYIAFGLPILIVVFYFLIHGAFSDFFRASFSQNVGYVGYGNYFLFPQGLLVFKLLILMITLLGIIRWRQKIGMSGAVIYIWLAFSLFNAFFSNRPYTHYVLVLLPAVCLLLGYICDANRNVSMHSRNILKGVNAAIFCIVIFLVALNFSIYKNISLYYKNYCDFVFGKKPVTVYQSFFDGRTPQDYEIARFIKLNTTPSDSIFLWSDSGQIYALSRKLPIGRYIVAYHITFYKDATAEIQKKIIEKKPKYIIDTKHGKELFQFLKNYALRYKIADTNIYERL